MNRLDIKYISSDEKKSILVYNRYANRGLLFIVFILIMALIIRIFYNDSIGIGFIIIFIGLLDIYFKCKRTEIAFFDDSSKISIITTRILKRVVHIPLRADQQLPTLVVEMDEHQNSAGHQVKGVQLTVLANDQQQTLLLVDFAQLFSLAECQSVAHEANTFIQDQFLRLNLTSHRGSK